MTTHTRKEPIKPISIMIEQLDADGNVYRIFTSHVWPWELDQKLETIARAYNMDHTRVTHNG